MDGTVHCGAADHDSIKLLAMAVVADGKKGVCPPTAAETCQTCFASLLLSLSFFLSLVSRLYWRAPVTAREHFKILLLAGLHIRRK